MLATIKKKKKEEGRGGKEEFDLYEQIRNYSRIYYTVRIKLSKHI